LKLREAALSESGFQKKNEPKQLAAGTEEEEATGTTSGMKEREIFEEQVNRRRFAGGGAGLTQWGKIWPVNGEKPKLGKRGVSAGCQERYPKGRGGAL